jgi:valyl-tRNA synthetase
MVKSRLYGTEAAPVKQAIVSRAIDVYDAALRLLHPLMPFVTEELWQNIRRRGPVESIMHAQIMKPESSLIDTDVEKEMIFVQNVIESLRTIRSEMGIPPSKDISLLMRCTDNAERTGIQRYEDLQLARVNVELH